MEGLKAADDFIGLSDEFAQRKLRQKSYITTYKSI